MALVLSSAYVGVPMTGEVKLQTELYQIKHSQRKEQQMMIQFTSSDTGMKERKEKAFIRMDQAATS